MIIAHFAVFHSSPKSSRPAGILKGSGESLLLIDEIIKSANFAAHLKTIRETFDLQVIFSSSSVLRLQHELADLSRRAVIYTEQYFEACELTRHPRIPYEYCYLENAAGSAEN